ncbi:MAG: glucose 1-dehydrogenase [Nitrospinota bacterium]|nr:MAG: glucose 1-dehydrogenase [Nitrospinota bacterium]
MSMLQGKVALITGGGTGIGRASALALAGKGASIAINYSRSQAEAEKTAEDVRALGPSAITIQADVSQDAAVRAMVQKTVEQLGRIDILVNNAGFTKRIDHRDLEGVSEEVWDRTMAVNLKGVFFCCRAVVPYMRQQGNGTIINIASVAGVSGTGSSIPYAASKGGVITLTKSLARVLAPEIRVNAIAPGLVETRWIQEWADVDQVREQAIRETRMGRILTPEDVAEVVLFLATQASMITGQTILIDGGRTI